MIPEHMTSNPEIEEQSENLKRVATKLEDVIMEFHRRVLEEDVLEFFGFMIEDYCKKWCSCYAPGSATRILRKLRNEKRLDYEVINRRQSLYRFKMPEPEQGKLFE